MIIHREYAGNLGLHHLEACMDKSRKNERKFTLSVFETGCCVVCYVVPNRDYCKGIWDKGGGKLDYGLQLCEKMRIQDVFSWTSIITTYVWTGQEDRAIKAFIRMQEAGVSPNEYTFAGVISRVANLARVEWGEQLHAHVLQRGFISLLSVENSIVTMHAKCGCLASGSKVFHEMSRRDIVSWNTLIAGYSQGGYGEEAFQFLSWMRRDGPQPNEFALASVLSVCGSMAMLEQGKQLHTHVLFVGLEFTSMVQSALVNMHSKCGSIKEAAIFDVTELSDIISWTAMINGYAEHGFYREPIVLFKKIPRVGLKPDLVTFIGVLVACCHAGMVDLGFHYNSMSNDFGINPAKEHYGCTVDLLYQAGRLGEAEDMIKSMPFQQDDVVWSTLLRACRLHGDTDCRRRAVDEILKLDPSCAATHITLVNMYAAKGKWREAVEVRIMMRSKGVIKEPGWSWIKVKDQPSEFVADLSENWFLTNWFQFSEIVDPLIHSCDFVVPGFIAGFQLYLVQIVNLTL
ncbi:pentatricopeptide repeat-containing protein [Pyrus ussuriensis x Pyrus communis]|uniref:Pentatricopeptide repeat-containing protein n=1 Tax=Pyrus ussuriensis x Pyrus communis TaxID=2448454 RepID=A0A5N5FIX4_9ROSA|nr:pentatricopeptide repeat-containing protein [Pyrus ussuriensis x Pyrus communis]